MKCLLQLLLIGLLLPACNKTTTESLIMPATEANYRMVVQLSWQNPGFTVPAANAHFTAFVGMVHSADTFLWKPGQLASVGLEFVAEVGSNGRINAEMDNIIAAAKARKRFSIPPPTITGSFDTVLNFHAQHTAVSFVSMIAPSPDWFVGLNSGTLLQNNEWVDELTLPLYLYDAGTEEGDIFGYDNPPSSPQQFVKILNGSAATVLANGNSILPPVGTVRFTRL